MASTSRAAARRGKPSYAMSIIGVTLVLFLLGLVGWLAINATKIGDSLRENVEVKVFLRTQPSPKDSTALMNYMSSLPYMRKVYYVNKELARQKYLGEGNEDYINILEYNPLPDAVFFTPKSEYVQTDSLTKISREISAAQSSWVSDIQYPVETVSNLNKNLRNISLVILAIAIILSIVVIVLIDNTIRLAMFSNRFLIKTMQMVGATRNFIARPMNIRAIINGSISAGIAIVLIYILVKVAENFIPWVKVVNSSSTLLLLFLGMLIIGISITVFSTYRSVLKYLRMKLDELY